eukprot:4931308-Pyramimonas_sp.AAC.1
MSVNVLERLLARLLPAVGLTGALPDRWASGTAAAELEATRTSSVLTDLVCEGMCGKRSARSAVQRSPRYGNCRASPEGVQMS